MDKDTILNAAPLACAAVVVIGGLVAFCVRPLEANDIKDLVKDTLVLCGTAWQASRTLKQPGA